MLRRSKSILQIYEETKHYDLVITNDAPLATGLNKLIEKPRLDYFALTPKQLASKYSPFSFERLYTKSEIILEISKISGRSLPMIHQSVEKIFEVWNHTGLLESCELFLSGEKEFLSLLRKFPPVELAMEEFNEDYFSEKSIAVVGYDLFTELDKQVLPKRNKNPDKISVFTEDELKIDKTYIFSSANDLINSTVGLISKDNADETAIILNNESDYLEILKARLIEKGIRCEIRSMISDDTDTRNFLTFIDASFNSSDLKVKEIIFLESLIDINIDRYFSNYYLSGYLKKVNRSKQLKEICDVMSSIEKYTYAGILDKLEFTGKREFTPELRGLLQLLDLSGKKITQTNFNMLNYFIKNIDAEISGSREGVLFVSSKNSAFIDRPVTIFIGLDESWTKTYPDKEYINKKEEEKKNLDKFQILLSQGSEKLMFAVNVKNNVQVIPCYYFNILSGTSIRNFENNFFNPVLIRPEKSESKFIPLKVNFKKTECKPLEQISPSSLNNYTACPKKYSYSRMLPEEGQTYFLKGNLLHWFAELYFNHPEYVKENFEKIHSEITDEYGIFLKEMNTDIERTVFRIGMKAIMSFLDKMSFAKQKLDPPENSKDNFLFSRHGKKKIFSNTEKWIKNSVAGINGKIDLSSEKYIVDYKSGKNLKSNTALLKEFRFDKMMEEKNPDLNFQTIAYLAGTRDTLPGEILNFIYFFFLSNINDVIAGKENPDKSIAVIKYIPLTFKEFILSKECYDKMNEELTESKGNDILMKTGFSEYRKLIEDRFDDKIFFKKESVTETFQEAFYDLLMNKLGYNLKDFRKNKIETFLKDIVQPLLAKLNCIRTGEKGEAFIFKDDADEFIKFAKNAISEINLYQRSDFPNKPLFDLRDVCVKCDFLNICTGNKLWSGND